MNKEEILNKYINLIDKGYCCDCNELNCIDNFPHSKITHAIKELQQENKILKENAENNDKVVDKVNWENQLLKKQLEEYKATNKILSHELTKDKVLQQDCLITCCGIPIGDIPKLITQQKEFIEYMNKTIEELECDDVGDEEMKGYLIQRIDTFKEILRKYKSIIGVSDEKEN